MAVIPLFTVIPDVTWEGDIVVLRSFPQFPSHVQTVQLGDSSYRLLMEWSERLGCWRMTLTDEDGVAVVTGVRVEPGRDLLRYSDASVAPVGKLMAVNVGGCGRDKTRSTASVRVSGANPATILPGDAFTDTSGNEWLALEYLLKAGGSTVDIDVVAAEKGAVEAAVGTITTHIYGAGVACTNILAAVAGVDHAQTLQADLGGPLVLAFYPGVFARAATEWALTFAAV